MATLDQAVNGTVENKLIQLREVMKYSSFFKDGLGNRYTLQMNGETDKDGNDEYELYRDHYHNPIGLCVYDNTDILVVSDHGKNISYIVLNGLHLYPYIEKSVML
ncbi:hypothetical protein vBAbaMD22_150 [Acinetobacter phage vB_AbaM_D22]|nr:hypothetical protein vBAbaMD22_150 [Acinetobacter phage vB_AbaM_D22]